MNPDAYTQLYKSQFPGDTFSGADSNGAAALVDYQP